jgi:hypothetical protein
MPYNLPHMVWEKMFEQDGTFWNIHVSVDSPNADLKKYSNYLPLFFWPSPVTQKTEGNFLKKLANHVTSGGVTFEVSSRKFFYCTCVAHYQRNFLELCRCSCIVDMRHNCIFCGLLCRRYKIIIHLPSLFSFMCCFAPPLSLKLIFSQVYLGIIVDASPL